MKFSVFIVLALAWSAALALTPEAKEFLAVSKRLEPVQCEKRQLRRKLAMAEVRRFAELDRNPDTAKLEKRLATLEQRLRDGSGRMRDAEDLQAISYQQREAFYRCE